MKRLEIIGAVLVLANSLIPIWVQHKEKKRDAQVQEIIEDYQAENAHLDSLIYSLELKIEATRQARDSAWRQIDSRIDIYNQKLNRLEKDNKRFRARLDDIGELPEF